VYRSSPPGYILTFLQNLKIRQQINLFLRKSYPGILDHRSFIFRWQIVLLAYLEQRHSNGGPVSFQMHASTVLILLAHWLPILLKPKRTLFESTPPGVGQSSERLDRLFENFNVTAKDSKREKPARISKITYPRVQMSASKPHAPQSAPLVTRHRSGFVGRR
jgi:hypothetical protein